MHKSKEIWLVRHGETEWSMSGQHTGRTDIPLTENGARRARLLTAILAEQSFSSVLTSPLLRASETCRLAGYGETARISHDLLEWNYGVFEGRTTLEIREELPDWSIWDTAVPGGESIEEVAHRAQQAIAAIMSQPGDALVFSHGHFLRILTACWLGLEPQSGAIFALDAGSISILGFERETRVLRNWNRTMD